VEVYVLFLNGTLALPAVALFNVDVMKSRRAQAIRQYIRQSRAAGVAEM
jgi:hypothetical protein